MTIFDEQIGPLEVDLDSADIPPGVYLAELQSLRLDIGPSGHPYFEATFRLCGPGKYAGNLVYTILSFHPRSLQWTVERLTTIAGHALPRAVVNLRDDKFQAQFLRHRARLQIGVRLVGLGRREPEVRAILAAEQPTLPQEETDHGDD